MKTNQFWLIKSRQTWVSINKLWILFLRFSEARDTSVLKFVSPKIDSSSLPEILVSLYWNPVFLRDLNLSLNAVAWEIGGFIDCLLTILVSLGINLSIGRGESRSVFVVFDDVFAEMFVLWSLNLILVLSSLYFVYSHKESIEVRCIFSDIVSFWIRRSSLKKLWIGTETAYFLIILNRFLLTGLCLFLFRGLKCCSMMGRQ